MTIIHYFAYGSNMLTERLQARCASAKFRHVACARDWKLTFTKRSRDRSGKAMISPCAGRQALGVVFDLDESELPKLDQLEGVRKGYDRKDDLLVHVGGSKEPLSVVTYIANPSHIDTNLEPFDWYLSLVVVGARQHKLPPDYASFLEATSSMIDPEPDRESRREALKLLGVKPLPDDTHIAGEKSVADWTAMRGHLTSSNGPDPWKDAFEDFFKARLESRYFGPIRAIEKLNKNVGEGFAIVALHCSLIEFLASTLKGKSFKYQGPLGPFEYSKSGDVFTEFLEKAAPFKTMFSKEGSARDFYSSVRCGLLHEARTKGCWKIRVSEVASQAIDVNGAVVYRNKMQAAFDQFVSWYEQQLPTDSNLQQAFIRKFDSLCHE